MGVYVSPLSSLASRRSLDGKLRQSDNVFSSCSHPVLSSRDSTSFTRYTACSDPFMSSDHTNYYPVCSLETLYPLVYDFQSVSQLGLLPVSFLLPDLLSFHPSPVLTLSPLVLLRLAARSDAPGLPQLCSVPIPTIEMKSSG